jgi:hypothetical protein
LRNKATVGLIENYEKRPQSANIMLLMTAAGKIKYLLLIAGVEVGFDTLGSAIENDPILQGC